MTEGILFFSVPPDVPSLNGWSVNLAMKDGQNDEIVSVVYGRSGTIAQREKEEPEEEAETYGSK